MKKEIRFCLNQFKNSDIGAEESVAYSFEGRIK